MFFLVEPLENIVDLRSGLPVDDDDFPVALYNVVEGGARTIMRVLGKVLDSSHSRNTAHEPT